MKKRHLFFISVAMLAFACNTPPTSSDEMAGTDSTAVEEDSAVAEPENDAPESYEKDGLKIYPASESPQFADAKLMLKSLDVKASKKVGFDFGVEGYTLGEQTADAAGKGLANSDKGQHIHLIVDNGPYSAHYMPGMESAFEDGRHFGIAFLSRSYHESVKSADAYQTFQFTVGKSVEEPYDMTQPILFYSRPKGEYSGADTEKILFDFYLVNTELSAGGNSVILTINGSSEFEFDTWQPYIIEGLPKGENTFEIKLVNSTGELINPEMNQTKRTFTLK